MPAVPPPRRMTKPPSIFDRNKKKKPQFNCCPEPKPEDDDNGHLVCMNCFVVLADGGNIVNEVTFSEDARGAATAQGSYVNNNARHANTLGAGARRLGGGERDASQNAAANARKILGGLCPRLNLSETVRDQAVSLYQLASASNFSAGRRTEEVVAACLYAVCRRQRENQVLLIDISELQRINVFRLGEVYKALCKDVYLEVGGKSSTDKIVGEQHQLEVESLIMKYCRKLEFGNQTRQVAEDAARILRRMKRDWIVTGRHPAGLCGACIIYAARMNNFRRTKREVVYVAKVADQTVAKRMEEFKRTRSAAMTVEQFRQKGLLVKQTHDPPAIAYAKQQKEKLEEKKRKRQSMSAAPEVVELGADQAGSASRESSAVEETPDAGQEEGDGPRKRQRTSNGTPATPGPSQQEPRFDTDGFAIPALPASLIQPAQPEQPKKRGRGRPRKEDDNWAPSSEELMAEAELEREIQEMLEKDSEDDSLRVAQEKLDADKALERDEERERKEKEGAAKEKEREKEAQNRGRTVTFDDEEPALRELATAEELEAEFANDLEVMNCLLPDMERRVKEQIWVAENEDWMRVQVIKEINARLDKETKKSGAGRKSTKGRRKKGRMGDGSTLAEATTPIETPLDANKAVWEKRGMPKGVSRHINYEVLKSVYRRSPSSTSQSRDTSEAPTEASRAPSVAPSEISIDDGGAMPAPDDGQPQTPPPTQRPQPVVTTPVDTGAGQPDARLPSPPDTQAQTTAGAEQAPEDEDDGDGEGDANDYVQDEELDYGSDEERRGGWLGGDDDDREDIGEDEYGPLSRNALPHFGDDEGDEYD